VPAAAAETAAAAAATAAGTGGAGSWGIMAEAAEIFLCGFILAV
jgi:hypothetical protein